jgi:hypothetical protein
MIHWEIEDLTARNEFRIIVCHERDGTPQKSLGKAKFTSAEGCAIDRVWLASTLGGRSPQVLSLMHVCTPH